MSTIRADVPAQEGRQREAGDATVTEEKAAPSEANAEPAAEASVVAPPEEASTAAADPPGEAAKKERPGRRLIVLVSVLLGVAVLGILVAGAFIVRRAGR